MGSHPMMTGTSITSMSPTASGALFTRTAGAASVAVCLLHSYANSAHEEVVAEGARTLLPRAVVEFELRPLESSRRLPRTGKEAPLDRGRNQVAVYAHLADTDQCPGHVSQWGEIA